MFVRQFDFGLTCKNETGSQCGLEGNLVSWRQFSSYIVRDFPHLKISSFSKAKSRHMKNTLVPMLLGRLKDASKLCHTGATCICRTVSCVAVCQHSCKLSPA